MVHQKSSPFSDKDNGATVVISHRVRSDCHTGYEEWLDEIVPACNAASGFLDWHVVRPIRDLTDTYTFIIRFDTDSHLRDWMESPVRNALIAKVQPLLVSGDDFQVRSGLDFWFTPADANAALPVRWKQFLITWSAIFPLVLVVPLILAPLLEALGLSQNLLITTAIVSAVVVFLMIYLIMPPYTRWVSRWLFSVSSSK